MVGLVWSEAAILTAVLLPVCFVPIYEPPQLARRAKLQGTYIAFVIGTLYFATNWGEKEYDNIARYTCL